MEDITKRIEKMRKNARENNNQEVKNPNDKECPFKNQMCNDKCKLYRKNKPGYECPFQEVSHMSWNINSLVEGLLGKKKGGG